MRVGFYDPYLEILGGGEKVFLTILEEAVRSSHEVVLFAERRPDPARWRRLNVEVAADEFSWARTSLLGVVARSRGLDLLVVLHNDVPPPSLARRSVVVMQFPFTDVRGGSRWRAFDRRARLGTYDEIVCYSEFVRRHIAERLGRDALVVHPPVDVTGARVAADKERTIIAVGRFFPAADANNKKHGLMVEAFRALAARAPGWELHLAGGCHADPGSQAYLAGLRRQAEGLPIHFHPNAEPDALDDLYARASLFWHAAGHGEERPERQEHFGITTVEAMSHGSVPIVPALGGQVEIVADGENGRLWHSVDEFVSITAELAAEPARAERLRKAAIESAPRFSKERFGEAVREKVLRAPS
jgi:glycosyltransferase involved in cell wall biosynthesis